MNPFAALIPLTFVTCLCASCGEDSTNKNDVVHTPIQAQSNGQLAVLKDVSNAEFAELIATKPEALLLDVRTPEEWGEGHLQGAAHADYWGDEKSFQQAMDAIPRDRPVLVYCAGGGRSGLTANDLAKAGHQEVYNLENGITGWMAEGMPVVTGPAVEIQD